MHRPAAHQDDVIVEIAGYPVWKRRADLQDDDLLCFFDGDYADVLEPDDPRLQPTALSKLKASLRAQFGEREPAPVTLEEFGLSGDAKP
ncbi:hypothetical protein [Chitinimonas sp.]|uniref:hypothetical protein n=1 Tax=Chitinimonas sp. TaxID=1934313 RepID=UPI0035B37FC8